MSRKQQNLPLEHLSLKVTDALRRANKPKLSLEITVVIDLVMKTNPATRIKYRLNLRKKEFLQSISKTRCGNLMNKWIQLKTQEDQSLKIIQANLSLLIPTQSKMQ